MTPLLLLSVRTPGEIDDALSAGADIVDLKEPRRGALSPAGVDLWRHAATIWKERRRQSATANTPPLSAALGERDEAMSVASQLPVGFSYAKVGPSGCDSTDQLRGLWSQIGALLGDGVELVAVAYADYQAAGCPHPEQVFEQAIASGLRYGLVDTFAKDSVSTLEHLGVSTLSNLSMMAEQSGLWWSLSGSMRSTMIAPLWSDGVRPTCFGVRGDVCDRGRTGKLSRGRVRAWQRSLAECRTGSGSSRELAVKSAAIRG